MSAGVSDQRMKGQGNQVSNVSKEQLESGGGGGEELGESWRHQQQQQAQSYAPPISSAADPYTAAGYYGTAGTAAFPYQAFGVGDGTWSTNGTDPITFLGGYAQHETYGMEGVFGPSTTAFSTAAFGQQASAATFNYFHNNGDFSAWGKPYDDYYHHDGLYVKTVEAGVRGLSVNDATLALDKDPKGHEPKDSAGLPKKTWATVAGQPAKPQPAAHSSGLKKKGPGMPPPPIVPGKHNMDIGTWDTGKANGPGAQPPPPPATAAPPPQPKPQPQLQQQQQQQHMQMQHQHQQQQQVQIQQQAMAAPPQHQNRGPPAARPPWTGPAPSQRAPPPRPQPQQQVPLQMPPAVAVPPPAVPLSPVVPHPVLDELKIKNNYNPADFDLGAPDARFFVIKSYSEDDIHRSIKYEIWCSTEHGNKRLDSAFREREKDGRGVVYLFFSVNGSGHFCGMAQMVSAVDYDSDSGVWSQDKWKGQFKVRWVYVKDVPNVQLRHIRLENNENKPVTNSRDTQEVPHAKGLQVLRMMHGYRHSTSIFDDFIHYEKRQEEEDSRKVPDPPPPHHHQPPPQQGHPKGGPRDHRPHQGHQGDGYDPGDRQHHHAQGYDNKHEYGGGGKNPYGRDQGHGGQNRDYRDHGGFNKDHGGGFGRDHHQGGSGGGGFHKDQHGYGNNGDGYGYKGNRTGDRDRDQHGGGGGGGGGGGYRDHRDQQGSGGYRSHHPMQKDRGEGPGGRAGGGRGRGRPN